MITDRAEARLLVSPGAILSVSDAATLLGWDGADRWLRDRGLVARILTQDREGRARVVERVVWSAVLALLQAQPEEREEPRRRELRRGAP